MIQISETASDAEFEREFFHWVETCPSDEFEELLTYYYRDLQHGHTGLELIH